MASRQCTYLHLKIVARRSITRHGRQIAYIRIKELLNQVIEFLA